MLERLGPYELIEIIGEGGFSKAYRARHTRLRRDVLVVVLLPREETYSFRRGVEVCASLTHPNIEAIFDIDTESDPPYYTTLLNTSMV